MINETRFQYIGVRSRLDGNNDPTIAVQESFISGGSNVGQAHTNDDRWELQNYSTLTKGTHVLRFGARPALDAIQPQVGPPEPRRRQQGQCTPIW